LAQDTAKEKEEMAPMVMVAPDLGKNEIELGREVERGNGGGKEVF
jgi:hypothetical protein